MLEEAIPWLLGLAALVALAIVSGCVRYIANDRIAIVEKLWSTKVHLTAG